MIDDVTIVRTTVGLGTIRIRGAHKEDNWPCPDGQTRPWQVVTVRGAVVMLQPEAQLLRLKLSFPRLAYPASNTSTYNFPLCSNPQTLDLTPVAGAILAVLGIELGEGENAVEKLGLLRCGVTRIAYAVDAHVDDGEQTLVAAAGLRRKYARQIQEWRRPGQPLHALQFDAGEDRLMLYRKDEEIRSRIKPLRGRHRDYGQLDRENREALAEQAKNVVRVEYTLKSTKALRALWGCPGGELPTLAAMLRPEVGAYLLGHQMALLGLTHLEAVEPRDDADPDLAPFLTIAEKCRTFTSDGCVGASRARGGLRGTRVMLLYAAHRLIGKLTDEKLQEACGGMSAGSFAALRKDLESIGVLTGMNVEQQNHLRGLVGEFQRKLPMVPESLPDLPDDLVVRAPWAEALGDKDVADIDEDCCVSLGGIEPEAKAAVVTPVQQKPAPPPSPTVRQPTSASSVADREPRPASAPCQDDLDDDEPHGPGIDEPPAPCWDETDDHTDHEDTDAPDGHLDEEAPQDDNGDDREDDDEQDPEDAQRREALRREMARQLAVQGWD